MKLWTNEELLKVENDINRVHKLMEPFKNSKEVVANPKQILDQLTLMGQAFDEVKHYKSKVEEMQKVLEWYADEKNWGSIEEYGAFISDGGERARQTLKGVGIK